MGLDWLYSQVRLEGSTLHDASRPFDSSPAMPYVERNFRGYIEAQNP